MGCFLYCVKAMFIFKCRCQWRHRDFQRPTYVFLIPSLIRKQPFGVVVEYSCSGNLKNNNSRLHNIWEIFFKIPVKELILLFRRYSQGYLFMDFT